MATTITGNSAGIGTSNPITTAGNVLDIYGAANIRAGHYLQWGNGGSYAITSDDSTHLRMITDGAERMRIDSAGRVTMPYQPAFSASSTSYIGGGTWSGYTDLNLNIGNHFNQASGKFTAPTAGTYMFTFGTIGNPSHTDVDIYLVLNNVVSPHLGACRPDDTGAWASMGINVSLVYLNANDVVEVWSSAQCYSDSNHWVRFRGHLIG